MTTSPRTAEQRKQDTLHRLEHDVDAWVATADPTGTPYLVPLSYLWDGETLLISTAAANPTARNLRANGRVRLTVGPTRDVVLIEGAAEIVAELPAGVGDEFAAKTGFDPRRSRNYPYFRIRPELVQAWREADELAGRDLMVDGRWRV
ncbi:pyridoxamine 5'-phosphate oxidase family protein [Catellatospora tritici]|uniref:pyridoxamine 5'-phosphate oxidase family protein n=1 Tax=Catellatospora tritici TaxID=2851566 RepID=UPI001C2CF607|nr:pyridoxamine 5'-phosphate oxidase family protein [Catellatospora tritici]MBV1855085.1 pyridoxamine 5'-phosphate oxidase family protein [Catellatospora tritici]